MISIEIRSARHSYPVLIGPGLLAGAADAIGEKLPAARCAVISDKNIAPHFAGRVQKSLAAAGFEVKLITVPAGEESKNLERAGVICEQMLSAGLDRESFLLPDANSHQGRGHHVELPGARHPASVDPADPGP